MNKDNLSDVLFQRMSGEMEQYKSWLLTLPPEQILDHTCEYTAKQDILCAVENADLSQDQMAALLTSNSPLEDVFRNYQKKDLDNMADVLESLKDVASRREMLLYPVYQHSGAYALEHDESDQYRVSFEAKMLRGKSSRLWQSCAEPSVSISSP